ncbi:hypothetical protein [Burkholderia pyrrocinia]|uniref:hypothetical protein n=1 Tax=Burkholderia pyrrocinia TaxID=60550 RepID=UPI00201B7469|nr:hypothetical protein [Burkholderia pyrrocinia]
MKTIVNELRAELSSAHVIIRNALGVATFDQKIEWGNANERDGVIGEGVTCAHERHTAIASGVGLALLTELERADRIIANVAALLSAHQRELLLIANRQDGVNVSFGQQFRQIERAVLLRRAVEVDLRDLLRINGAADQAQVAPDYAGRGWVRRIRTRRDRVRDFEAALLLLQSGYVGEDLVRVVEQFPNDAVHYLNTEHRRLLRKLVADCLERLDQLIEAGLIGHGVAEKDR